MNGEGLTILFKMLVAATVTAHVAFTFFAVLGGFLVLKWRWLLWLQVPALAWIIVVVFANRSCPLTALEQYFRVRAGMPTYEGGFILHYFGSWGTQTITVIVTSAVIFINAFIYWRLLSGRKVNYGS